MLIELVRSKQHRMLQFVPNSLDEGVPWDQLVGRVEAYVDLHSSAVSLAKWYRAQPGCPAVPQDVFLGALAIE